MLVGQGFIHATEAADAVGALATAGVLESALVEAAVAEAEDALGDAPLVDAQRGVRLLDHAERLELDDQHDVAGRDREVVVALGLAGAVQPARPRRR